MLFRVIVHALAVNLVLSQPPQRALAKRNRMGSLSVNCEVSPWTDWNCSDGMCVRTRRVLRKPSNGGIVCPDLQETKETNSTESPWDSKNVLNKIQSRFASRKRGPSLFGRAAFRKHAITILPRDLIFVLDMSGSINFREFYKVKRQIGEMIGQICGTIGKGPQDNRISVIAFSSRVQLRFNFKKYSDINKIKRAIMYIRPYRGATCTGDALQFVNKYLFDPKSGIRDATESVKEVLVLSDGRSNCGSRKKLAAEGKKLQVKATVFALAIGRFSSKGKAEIESMVSRPLTDHIFSLSNFKSFIDMVDALKTFPDKCVPFELSR